MPGGEKRSLDYETPPAPIDPREVYDDYGIYNFNAEKVLVFLIVTAMLAVFLYFWLVLKWF